ncbi:unnamed protein product [Paramecium octaurelia]|nr:unnamed protein product [Paramecium octaurelia]
MIQHLKVKFLKNEGKYDQSLELLESMLVFNPDNIRLIFERFQQFDQLDSDQQIKYIDYLLVRFPQQIFLFWVKGFTLMNQNIYDEALLTFNAALSKDPYNFWIASFKASTLSELKKYQEAVDLLYSILDESPENIKVSQLINEVLFKMNNINEQVDSNDETEVENIQSD